MPHALITTRALLISLALLPFRVLSDTFMYRPLVAHGFLLLKLRFAQDSHAERTIALPPRYSAKGRLEKFVIEGCVLQL